MVIPIKTDPDNYFVWSYQCLRPLSMFYHLFQWYKFLELHLRSFHHSLLFLVMDLMNFYLQVSNPVALHLVKKYLEQGSTDHGFGKYLPGGSFFWTTWLILSVLLLMENNLNNCSVFVKVKKRFVWFLYGHPRV